MSYRVSLALRTAISGVAALAIFAPAAFSADSAKAAKPYKVPRTEFGQPDLQGNWTNATITPLERPESFGERNVLTEQEAAKLEQAEALKELVRMNEQIKLIQKLRKPRG